MLINGVEAPKNFKEILKELEKLPSVIRPGIENKSLFSITKNFIQNKIEKVVNLFATSANKSSFQHDIDLEAGIALEPLLPQQEETKEELTKRIKELEENAEDLFKKYKNLQSEMYGLNKEEQAINILNDAERKFEECLDECTKLAIKYGVPQVNYFSYCSEQFVKIFDIKKCYHDGEYINNKEEELKKQFQGTNPYSKLKAACVLGAFYATQGNIEKSNEYYYAFWKLKNREHTGGDALNIGESEAIIICDIYGNSTSNPEKRFFGADSIGNSLVVILHDPKSKATILAYHTHILQPGSLKKVIKELPLNIEFQAYLIGASGYNDDSIPRELNRGMENLEKVINTLSKYENINICGANIGEKSLSAIVIDAKTGAITAERPSKPINDTHYPDFTSCLNQKEFQVYDFQVHTPQGASHYTGLLEDNINKEANHKLIKKYYSNFFNIEDYFNKLYRKDIDPINKAALEHKIYKFLKKVQEIRPELLQEARQQEVNSRIQNLKITEDEKLNLVSSLPEETQNIFQNPHISLYDIRNEICVDPAIMGDGSTDAQSLYENLYT